MDLLQFTVNEIKFFGLILIRVASLLFATPFFGSGLIISRGKLGLAVVLTLVLYPLMSYDPTLLPDHWLSYVTMVFSEVFFGLVMGFLIYIIFFGIQFAGQLIGTQMGFAIVSVLDPQSQVQISIIGQVKFMIALLIFITMNGHYMIIEGLFKAFEVIPVAQMTIPDGFATQLIEISGWVFIYIFRLGAPAIISLFISEVAMGVIARTVPQMNIFIVGFPVKVSVGLISLIFMLPIWGTVFMKLINSFSREWMQLITLFKP